MAVDRREYMDDPEEALRAALNGFQAGLWCALPGIIESFDPVAMTVEVQPALRAKLRRPDGSVVSANLPLLIHMPVVFQGGGGFTLTFPVQAGDECLVVFADRCIDAWWQSGGIQEALAPRMHDLSDGFALVGVRSQPRVLTDVSATNVQLRADSGEDLVDISPDGTMALTARKVKVHAREEYSWDVNGFGESWKYVGDATWNHHTWQQGATVTSTISPINPPEGP